MRSTPTYLVTGAGGGGGGVSRLVVEQLIARDETVRAMVHREDSRANSAAPRSTMGQPGPGSGIIAMPAIRTRTAMPIWIRVRALLQRNL